MKLEADRETTGLGWDTIVRNLSDAVLAYDEDGLVRFWNRAAERMFGMRESEAVGLEVHTFIKYLQNPQQTPPDASSMSGECVADREGTEIPPHDVILDTSAIRSDATTFPAEISLSTGSIQGESLTFAVVRDATTRREVERKLRQQSVLLRDIVNHIPHFVFWKDRNLVYQGCNRNFAIVAGCESPVDIVGKTDFDLAWDRDQAEWFRKCDREVMQQNRPLLDIEETQHQADGKNATLLTSKVPLCDSRGEVIGMLGIFADVTRIKSTEEQLHKAKDEAEQANRAKSDFLANMSHEIRTPMTAILGYIELLLEMFEEKDYDQSLVADNLAIVHRNAEHLLSIIDDILDISKIEAKKVQIENVPCSPVTLIRQCEDLMRHKAEKKGLDFRIRFDGPIPQTIMTDPTRYRQVVFNLIGNAIKFTNRGGVFVHFRMIDAEGDSPLLECRIQDTGIGISGEGQKRLFHPFSQADSSSTRQHHGTGLGLVISKRIAEFLGGDLVVESERGEGSVFTFTCATGPLSAIEMLSPEDAAYQVEHSTVGPPMLSFDQMKLRGRILLVEDGVDNQRLFSLVLKKMGLDTLVAVNGLQGYEMAMESLRQGRPYDVILMDMQMPVMDGYTATRKLRESGYDRPIIALTAHALSSDREKCIAAGCNGYLSKPLRREQIFETLATYLIG